MAIQQHPLPQDISNYRFRLIGDMTIKQFAALAIFGIIAIVVYGLPLPFFFKYPLTFVCIVLGIGIAFVPVQGRTLDVWIVAFIKSIYAPTLFSWKRTPAEEVNQDTVSPIAGNTPNLTRSVSNPGIEINSGTMTTPEQSVQSAPTSTPADSTIIPNVIPVDQIPEAVTSTPQSATHSPVDNPTTPIPNIIPTQPEPLPAPVPETSAAPISAPAPTTNLPIPFTPTTPNTLVGLTITKDSHIIDGVLVEIKKNGITMRATKSNKLGQFMFARPLENGTFQILAEKENYTFTTYSLELTGEIIRPLKIQAQ